jgi:hypothetical protein
MLNASCIANIFPAKISIQLDIYSRSGSVSDKLRTLHKKIVKIYRFTVLQKQDFIQYLTENYFRAYYERC